MKKVLITLLVTTSLAAFTSCREKTTGEKIKDTTENVADDVGDAVDDAADEVEDAVE